MISSGFTCCSLALLELLADRLVFVVVFFLALDVAVHDNVAVIAVDLSRLEADWADSEVWLDIVACCHFVGHQVLVISRIRIRTQLHEELGNILSTTHRCKMQGCVAFVVGYVRASPMLEQELQYFVAAVMSGSL